MTAATSAAGARTPSVASRPFRWTRWCTRLHDHPSAPPPPGNSVPGANQPPATDNMLGAVSALALLAAGASAASPLAQHTLQRATHPRAPPFSPSSSAGAAPPPPPAGCHGGPCGGMAHYPVAPGIVCACPTAPALPALARPTAALPERRTEPPRPAALRCPSCPPRQPRCQPLSAQPDPRSSTSRQRDIARLIRCSICGIKR
jgi:hypothetical protein